MDPVILPDDVAWISDPLALQQTSEYIKRLVGIFKRIVFDVIDPQDPNLILCKTAIAKNVTSIEDWSCDYQASFNEREVKLSNELVNLLDEDFEKISMNNGDMFNSCQLMPVSEDAGTDILTNSNSPEENNDLQSKNSDFQDDMSNASGTWHSEDYFVPDEEENQSFFEKQNLQIVMAAYHALLTDYKNDFPRQSSRNNEFCDEEILGNNSDSDMDNFDIGSILPHRVDSEEQMSNTHEDIKYNLACSGVPASNKLQTSSKRKLRSGTTINVQCRTLTNHKDKLFETSSSAAIALDRNTSQASTPQLKSSYFSLLDQFISKSEHDIGSVWKTAIIQEQENEEIRREVHEKFVDESNLLEGTKRDQLLVDTENEFVISVSVFHPVEKDYMSKKDKSRYGEPKRLMQFKLLGTNTLAELRDFIVCQNDLLGIQDIYHPRYLTEKHLHKILARTIHPTGIIYINDTIYNDMRQEKAKDVANIIKTWAESTPAKHIGPFKVGEMSETCIKDLKIRFGYPYVYIHLGTCEHIIVFTNARKLSKADPVYKEFYPCLERKMNFKKILCKVDEEYLARWAVMDYDRFPESPMLVCNKCLTSFCYDSDGKRIGNFKLYPLVQAAQMFS